MSKQCRRFSSLILCIAALICLLSVSAIAADDDEVVGNKYSVAVSASVVCDAYADETIVTHPIAISPSSFVVGDADIEMYVSRVLVIPKNGWSIVSGPAYDAKQFSISIGGETVAQDLSGGYGVSFSKSNSPIVDGGIPVSINLDFGANSGEGDYSDIADIIVLMTADAEVIEIPTQTGELTYTGSEQYPSWSNYNASKVSTTGTTSATNAGDYTAVFTPKVGYCWSDGSMTSKEAQWSVGKAPCEITTAPTAKSLTYNGSAQELVNAGSSATGTIQYSIGTNRYPVGGTIYLDTGAEAGVTYTFYDTDGEEITYTGNIDQLEGADTYTVSGTPTKDRFYVIGPQISSKQWGAYGTDVTSWGVSTSETAYNGKANTNVMMNHIDSVKDNSGGTNTIWHWLQTKNNAKYGGCNDWFIPSKAELEAMRTSGKNSSLFSSSYVWSASALSNGPNRYSWYWDYGFSSWDSLSRSDKFSCVAVRTLGANPGAEPVVTVAGIYSTDIPTATNAGDYTVCYKVVGDSNHEGIEEQFVNVTIAKADYNMSGVSFSNASKTYNGETQGLTVSGTLPTGLDDKQVTVSYSAGRKDVGSTEITATFATTSTNYKIPEAKTATLTITQKEVTLSWGTVTWTYDGNAHSTTCTAGSLCSGDSCIVTLTGNSITNAGKTTVTASSLSNSNYQLPSAKTATLTVNRATISTTPSQSGSLTYSGSSQSPSWNNYDSNKMTLGGTTSATDAGTYTATFTPKDNYKWSDGTTTAKNVSWTIGKATISTPSQSGSLTYSGSSQSPSWNNYDSNKMTLGGTTSATNAGTYTATFTPKDNYKWSDGTTTAKNVSWTIDKATGSLSLSPTSLSFINTSAKTIAATRSEDGTVSATSSNTSVATVSVSGTTITVTPKGNGSATITVSVAAGTNYTAPSNKTCNVSVTLAKPIGGTIYLDTGAEAGVTYTFYDAGGNVINYTDNIDQLTNAETYTVSGTPTKDRFYVIGPQISSKQWGAYGTDVTSWGVSTSETAYNGKANTNVMMNHIDSVKDNSGGTNTIWHWLQTKNNAKYGGCNDWFIPSKAELEAMRTSGKNSSLFSSSYVWSASADSYAPYNNSWYWHYRSSRWSDYNRSTYYSCVAVRAF